jgi:hypothetical protein
VVTPGRMACFSGAAVTAGRLGPSSADDEGRGGGREGGGVIPMTEEERDSAVPGVAVKAEQMTRFSGVATTWRQLCGLGDVEEGARNFGSVTTSKSKYPDKGLRTRQLGFYRWTIVATACSWLNL